jgi:predicted nucleic acid-binding protein
MPRPRVYVETTIPSAYYDERNHPERVRMREHTRRWWQGAHDHYELVTALPVLDELAVGPQGPSQRWLSLVRDLPLLAVQPPIFMIVETYIRQKLMPGGGSADAYHLALASFHRCDFLVTWDSRHLANPNKVNHIRKVNTILGLHVPAIVTPLKLLGDEHGEA